MTEPLTPKTRHQALEQRVALLEQTGGAGTPGGGLGGSVLPGYTPLGTLSDSLTARSMTAGATEPRTVRTLTFTPNGNLRRPGAYRQVFLPGVTNLTQADVEELAVLAPTGNFPLFTLNVEPYVGGTLITTLPFSFGHTGDRLVLRFGEDRSVPVTAGFGYDHSLDVEALDGSGAVVPGVVGVELVPVPVIATPGMIAPTAMPQARVPSASGLREGHTELLLTAGSAPVLRVWHEGQWYALPLSAEQGGVVT
ncbi:hypothetical protein [Deinococcus depolymerans]|uniref:hypothetical protein n=1 Tax=Deinococcus depolymerans TaxID=392408 RepID=UPI0031DCFE4C